MGVDAGRDKSNVTRTFAERCVAGEFGGVANRAAQAPEALDWGISRSNILYFMNQIDPAAASARVAERLQAKHETTQAKEQGLRVVVVGGRGGWFGEKKLDEQAQR